MRGSRARNTSPMPPAPSSAVTSYGPSLVPGVMDTLLLQVNPHTLGLRVLLQRVAPLVAAEAGLLEAAERQGRVVQVVRVHPDRSRLQRAGDAVRLRDVARPYRGEIGRASWRERCE